MFEVRFATLLVAALSLGPAACQGSVPLGTPSPTVGASPPERPTAVLVHNRTRSDVTVGYSDIIDACTSREVSAAEAGTPRDDRPVAGVWNSPVAIAAPLGYDGPINVIITSAGGRVVFDVVEPADLPQCAGSLSAG